MGYQTFQCQGKQTLGSKAGEIKIEFISLVRATDRKLTLTGQDVYLWILIF